MEPHVFNLGDVTITSPPRSIMSPTKQDVNNAIGEETAIYDNIFDTWAHSTAFTDNLPVLDLVGDCNVVLTSSILSKHSPKLTRPRPASATDIDSRNLDRCPQRHALSPTRNPRQPAPARTSSHGSLSTAADASASTCRDSYSSQNQDQDQYQDDDDEEDHSQELVQGTLLSEQS